MTHIQFNNQTYTVSPGKSLLEELLAQNCRIPWSCRAGLCHSCLMQMTEGSVPIEACQGLSDDQMENGFFLACQCYPTSNMTTRLPERHLQAQPALITRKTILSPTLLAIRIAPRMPLQYRPGQHVRLWKNSTCGSRYCLLSQPETASELLIHVERRVGGKVSGWLFDEIDSGTQVTLSELAGRCYYQPDRDNAPLIIIGSGIGISAAMAITRDALMLSHSAALMTLLHSQHTSPETFYLQDHQISAANLQCINDNNLLPMIEALLLEPRFKQARLMLMGDPKIIRPTTRYLAQKGIPKARIITQSFIVQVSDESRLV
ncbi:MAG: 2Fe-2S iron-sulfur cluster binding domain-containing protein [Endozoicomonadaceae bacterium]|nr:2Fe-2S iron-sulfur cluster binding domain-containing protein [Endozoicomonadaceae bacterium]